MVVEPASMPGSAGRARFKGADVDVFLVVALVEVLAIGLGGEQRRHGGRVGRQVLQLVQTLQDIVARVGLEIIA